MIISILEPNLLLIGNETEPRGIGRALYRSGVEGARAGITCNMLDGQNAAAGPSLLRLRAIAGTRVSGISAEDYVRESILSPNSFITPGYSADFMFQNYAQNLTDEEVDALVAYVLSLA